MYRRVKSIWYALLDIVFPHRCIGCDRQLQPDEKCVCAVCWEQIPRTAPCDPTVTMLCGRFKDAGTIDRLFSPFYFEEEGILQKIVHALKYEGFTRPGIEGGKRAGEMILRADPQAQIDCIVPVPLHRSKKRERGYNQSDYIAKGIADVLGIAGIETSAVRRVRPTLTQTHLSVEERKANVGGAFRVINPIKIKGRHVLLVDDVITTGATVGECARVVKSAGAESVSVASVALARLRRSSL